MFGGSVRDRIKAAEAAQGTARDDAASNARRGHKLSLKTDEHIKEEFLRRGDGGWSKKVDIGQQDAYVAPPAVPFIKVTLETPIVESKEPTIPGKLHKNHFASISEEKEGDETFSPTKQMPGGMPAERPKQEESQKSPPVIVEPPTATIDPDKREIHPEYAEDTLPTRKKKSSSRRGSGSRQARVEDYDDPRDDEGDTVHFRDVDWSGSEAPSRTPSKRRHRKSSRQERPLLEEITDHEKPHDWSRPSRSKSAHRERDASQSKFAHRDHHDRDNHAESHGSPKIRRSSSRAGSTHGHASEAQHPPPTSARRSSSTLWPSFSQSERRSVGDILETSSIRSKSPRPRAHSAHSAASVRTDDTSTSRTLGAAAYFAGSKLENVATAPLSPPIEKRPLGFVRSKSSSGEYSEYYTRNKYILRRPDDDEVFESIDDHHKVNLERPRGHDEGKHERRKSDSTPWQVKLMQGIAKH